MAINEHVQAHLCPLYVHSAAEPLSCCTQPINKLFLFIVNKSSEKSKINILISCLYLSDASPFVSTDDVLSASFIIQE